MTLLIALRARLVKAVERGDPRLGLALGVALSLLVAFTFVRRFEVAERLDLSVLDLAFQQRRPIREDPRILLVDMDDKTFRDVPWPVPRDQYAQVILALDRLGAEAIVFDVQFKMLAPRAGDFDPSTGEYWLNDADRMLQYAIGLSGKVTMAYNFEPQDPLPPAVRQKFPVFLEALSRNFAAEGAELSARTGVPAEAFEGELETLRHQAALSLTRRMREDKPGLGFEELRDALLPGFKPELHGSELRLLHHAYWFDLCARLISEKAPNVRVEELPPRPQKAYALVPPAYSFVRRAEAAGQANAEPDLEDGVMRRPWLFWLYEGRPHLYLGLDAALRRMGGPDEETEAVIRRDRLEVRVRSRADGSPRRTAVMPVDDRGRLLVNWAGNGRRSRKSKSGQLYFQHVPFSKILNFYQERYETLDANVRRTLAQVADEDLPPHYREYLDLSAKMAQILQGGYLSRAPGTGAVVAHAATGRPVRNEVPPEEARKIEARMDEIRQKIIQDFRSDIAALEARIARLTSKRIIEADTKELEKRKTQLSGILSAYEQERDLKKLVEGKFCVIGSASTASGDLHTSPLGDSTPGMDVQANVMNMLLTGQAIWSVPRLVNFIYLTAVGVLVTLAVISWNAARSTLFTFGVAGASLAFYGYLFVVHSLLLSGFGPVATAVLAFAGVTTFKEVVTQRSKRKLQRELEKNTSAELVGILMEHPELLAKPRKMEGTFFFSDVKAFTSFSERMAPEVLVPYINRYLDRVTGVLKTRLGYLDKYIGDGIMALFGIPVPSADHARNACRAALESQELLAALNADFEREGLPRITTRIGINSGDAIAGYVGASDRSDYTVLGDAVNLASRLEGANKEYDTAILIAESTAERVAGEFELRELDHIRVVGKRNAVRIYELLAPAGAPLPVDPGFLSEYREALGHFKARRWQEALDGFERALLRKPGDRPCELYVTRANAFLLSPPPPDWEGVFELLSK